MCYLRKNIVNAILGKEIKIKRVIHDLRLEQLAREQKYGVLDIDVELENGEIINIEMQMNDHKNMEKRTTFYASKKITEQLGSKAQYTDLKKIIVIAILNYSFIDLPEYVTKTVRVADKHREYQINNDVTYYYIELKKFRKEGLKQGKKEEKIKTAKRLLKLNIPIEQIIEITQLSREEILKLKK